MSVATEPQTTSSTPHRGASEGLIKEIEGQVSAALTEMFRRAIKDGAVLDRKNEVKGKGDLELDGLVQDCEFGMILLLGRSWLRQRNAIPQQLGDETAVRGLIVKLVSDSVTSLLARKQSDVGRDSGKDVFFSGAPYTRIALPNKKEGYSANLDSAMLVLGFLAPALKEYHAELAAIAAPVAPAPWTHNLRDVALYVCMAGVDYATDCQVRLTAFSGFSCDPNSKVDDTEPPKPYLDEYDRLFFTWTASETIRDLLEWEGSLKEIAEGVPAEDVTTLSSGILGLKKTIEEAALWCKDKFLERLRNLKTMDVAAVIALLEKNDNWGEEQDEMVENVRKHVQHVYHLSQYAAIRSLYPAQVTLQEVNDICDRLDVLVSNDILKSKLDELQPDSPLFTTLTRSYKLGKSTKEKITYDDDAYYPLVVRSMAALLTRTMDRLVQNTTREDIKSVVNLFRRALQIHYQNLIERRPGDAADRDLWSFARKQPYILYATQRTIFALLAYADFLERMDRFDEQSDSDEILEADVKNLLGRELVENVFGRAVKEIVSMAMTRAMARRGVTEVVAAPLPSVPAGTVPMPNASWASEVFIDWLKTVTIDFERDGFVDYMVASAQSFLERRAWLLSAREPAADKGNKLAGRLTEVRASLQALMIRYDLTENATPTVDDLLPHFFRDLFNGPSKRVAEWKSETPEWLGVLKDIEGLQKRFQQVENREGRGT